MQQSAAILAAWKSACLANCLLDGTITLNLQQKIDWFGTARARVGLASGPVLSYVTAGFA